MPLESLATGLANGWRGADSQLLHRVALCDTPCRVLVLRRERAAAIEATDPGLMMKVYRLLLQITSARLYEREIQQVSIPRASSIRE